MVSYLDDMGVKASSLDPVRIGYTGDLFLPAIIWVGVLPGTLAPEAGCWCQCCHLIQNYPIFERHQ